MEPRRSTLGSIKRSLFGTKSSKEQEAYQPQAPMERQNSNPFRQPPATTPTRRPAVNTNASMAAPYEAPPVYSAAPAPAPSSSLAPSSSTSNARPSSPGPAADDRFSFLRSFDTIFLIDDSGSMAGSRWTQVSAALSAITPICTLYDRDGIDLKFINTPESPVHSNVTVPSTVHEIFSTVRPWGGTPTGQRLNSILKPYLRKLEANPRNPPKPVNIIVITDGEPSDDVESPIVAAAKKLDKLEAEPWQIGIQFFQVGGDAAAKRHLEELDDALSEMGGGCRDIVDTVPFEGRGGELNGEAILKVVLGAVNKRLDRKKGVVV